MSNSPRIEDSTTSDENTPTVTTRFIEKNSHNNQNRRSTISWAKRKLCYTRNHHLENSIEASSSDEEVSCRLPVVAKRPKVQKSGIPLLRRSYRQNKSDLEDIFCDSDEENNHISNIPSYESPIKSRNKPLSLTNYTISDTESITSSPKNQNQQKYSINKTVTSNQKTQWKTFSRTFNQSYLHSSRTCNVENDIDDSSESDFNDKSTIELSKQIINDDNDENALVVQRNKLRIESHTSIQNEDNTELYLLSQSCDSQSLFVKQQQKRRCSTKINKKSKGLVDKFYTILNKFESEGKLWKFERERDLIESGLDGTIIKTQTLYGRVLIHIKLTEDNKNIVIFLDLNTFLKNNFQIGSNIEICLKNCIEFQLKENNQHVYIPVNKIMLKQ